MILAIRIYGHDEHRLKVAVDREAPALKEAGWKLHRQEPTHLAVMSIGDREQPETRLCIAGQFACLSGSGAQRAAETLGATGFALAYQFNGDTRRWERVVAPQGAKTLTPEEAASLGLPSDPRALLPIEIALPVHMPVAMEARRFLRAAPPVGNQPPPVN